ncbi:MAG: elongation factor G [Bacteroidetes bacterium]|nr:elongation factor G [Bacteroidota bacterium]MBK6839569.1 elongation factor G [Bacteroidota bacterium]MBK9542134.1 elongation factor G [Bacteroidota bacterium]MBL0256348.1 elongation factor G [Bacteroidota bacterium]MBP6402589.1 elongation factor G [Bacteroidia bacterium]
MKVYDDKHIKNVALVGASKSGKTTLAEAMLFEAGLLNRRGTVEEKNTVSDYHDIEHERNSSVYATTLHTEWKDYKINIIDTPGLDDFIGEVISALRVADTAVMMLNAENGVEVGTELIWNYVEKFQKPILFAVNHVDHPKSDFDNTVEQAKERFGNAITIMQYPLKQGDGFNSIIDLLTMKMYTFPPAGGKPQKLDIPADETEKANALHNILVEKAAENDEKLMELYFEKGSLDEDQLKQGLKLGMLHHDVYPVFCLSAKKDMGSGRLMGFIDNVAPSATELFPEKTEDGKDLPCDPKGPPVVFVFKTLIEPHLGKLSFFKVMSGEVTTGMDLVNVNTGHTERINQLFIMDGKNRNPITKLTAGDIGTTLKLKETFTNQTLCAAGKNITIDPIHFPDPRLRVSILAKNKTDDEKLGGVLAEIRQEDPTVTIEYSRELRQVILGGQGELHLNVVKWRIEKIYHLEVEFGKPRIPYRETIQKNAMASYRHKKQSGGAGQFGEVYMKIEPFHEGMPEPHEHHVREKEIIDLPWGGKLVFYNCIVGGVIDQRFIPSIQKGVMEKMHEGPLTGSYVRDIRVIVYDGKMHPVDSNDISFKIAGMMAFKEAFHQADPKILEPIYDVEILVPEELMGDVVTDLQTRRSVIMGMDSQGKYQVIKARTPLSELDKYSTSLRSITQGRGSYTGRFAEYAPVPGEIQRKLADEYKSTEVH